MLESENQTENAVTEDVSQTDVDDDLEVLGRENQVENANDDLQDTESASCPKAMEAKAKAASVYVSKSK